MVSGGRETNLFIHEGIKIALMSIEKSVDKNNIGLQIIVY
jgi:hypothetical protein